MPAPSASRISPITRLIVVYLVPYLASTAWVAVQGVPVAMPRDFLPPLLMIVLPFAVGICGAGFVLEKYFGSRPGRLAVAAVLLGMALIGVYRTLPAQLVMDVLLGVAGWYLWTGRLKLGPIAAAFVCVSLILGTVWNVNYLLAAGASSRLHDPALHQIDMWVYARTGGPTQMEGMFPLTRSPLALWLIESAYVLLYPQILFVVFVFLEKGVPLGRLFNPMFACYLTGLVVFWAYPTIGPFTYYPESVQYPADSVTGQLMEMINVQYRAALEGGELNGAAFFIAVPSLHVAMAIVLQTALRVSRPHFWIMLPVNILMIVSTVALGFHYLVDVPAGVLLAAVVLCVFPSLRQPFAGLPSATGSGREEEQAG